MILLNIRKVLKLGRLALVLILMVAAYGCGGDSGGDEGNDVVNGDNGGDNGNVGPGDVIESISKPISSNSSASITLSGGFRIDIPIRAAPEDASGAGDETILSVKVKSVFPAEAPPGFSTVDAYYLLEVNDVFLKRAMQLSFMRPADVSVDAVRIMRYLASEDKWESLPFFFDESEDIVRTHVTQPGGFTLMAQEETGGNAWIKVDLESGRSGTWTSICVSYYSLDLPEQDYNFDPAGAVLLLAPVGTKSFPAEIVWRLPAGTYSFQATYDRESDSGCLNEPCLGWRPIGNGREYWLHEPNEVYEITVPMAEYDGERAPCFYRDL